MKITDKTQREIIQFSLLDGGDIFKSEDGSICLKFPKYVYENNKDEFCEGYNAYDLTNDEFTCFSLFERVEKVHAELVVSNFNEIIT